MSDYKEIKSALLELCEQEGLRFIETKLTNNGICYARKSGKIILNKNYNKFKEN